MIPGAPDITRLVEIITAEVMAAMAHGGGSVQCACHGVLASISSGSRGAGTGKRSSFAADKRPLPGTVRSAATCVPRRDPCRNAYTQVNSAPSRKIWAE